MSLTHHASRPKPPHLYERRHYYHGIRGRLLARTSTFEFPESSPPKDGHHFRFRNIGRGITHMWDDELVSSLKTALHGVNWQRFYPIRVRVDGELKGEYETFEPRERAVLIVDVVPGTMNWLRAVRKAKYCRLILIQAGIRNLHVEFREITRQFYGMDVDIERTVEQTSWGRTGTAYFPYERLVHMLSHVGYPVAPEASWLYGTMGLHVGLLVDGSTQYFGLTCRHVAHQPTNGAVSGLVGSWIDDSDAYMNLTAPNHPMIQASPQILKGIREDLWSSIRIAQNRRNHVGRRSRPGRVRRYAVNRMNEQLDAAIHIYRRLANIQDNPSARAIGQIAVMPPLEASHRGFIRDWALIRLNTEKFIHNPANNVFVSEQDMRAMVQDAGHDEGLNNLWQFLHVSRDEKGMAPLAGCASPGSTKPVHSFSVGKRGAATGFTYGMTNEVKATVRMTTDAGVEMSGWEWIVVPPRRGQPSVPQFCDVGDSGSAVFNFAGQIIGIVESGNVSSSGPGAIETADLGFVVPIEFIMDDIRQMTGVDVNICS
ncbi:hypothetical protein PT974_02187 [Cladobotryum mycophilum]|uniref:Uncharacterized protein n=1 Tax=Cladobotryum mycophilum TaxID=491253 RepID=A0ABR0SY79_9HYPO